MQGKRRTIRPCQSPTPSLCSHSWNLSNESGNVSYDTLGEKKRNRATYKGLLCSLPSIFSTLVFRPLCGMISGSFHTFSHVNLLGDYFSAYIAWKGVFTPEQTNMCLVEPKACIPLNYFMIVIVIMSTVMHVAQAVLILSMWSCTKLIVGDGPNE